MPTTEVSVPPSVASQRKHCVTDLRLIRQANRANSPLKRAVDVVVSFGLLFALSPALLLIAALIWLSDGASPLFRHRRVGRLGRPFDCWKFRTMRPDAELALARVLSADPIAAAEWRERQKLTRDPRVTPIGAFLRATSLDELPQLYNVLVGEMSLVGPRPVTRNELDRYGAERRYYLLVRPGITGLWQVSGRSRTSFEERVRLDRQFLQHWCFASEAEIIARTVRVVLARDGAM